MGRLGHHRHDPRLGGGLVLLGLGWSAATIADSTLLAESVGDDDRFLVQVSRTP